MSYDPEANLLYVGTGNAGPWTEAARGQKGNDGKDNLYAACILAVNPDTGALKWYYQAVPGDKWDFDAVQQLLLADLTIKGQRRKVIMQAGKNGYYYVLDRLTGKFISGQPFVQVTWAKGLDEASGRPIVNAEAYYGADSIAISPGAGGAHNWSPMSYNPGTGLVYIPATVSSSSDYAVDPNYQYQPGQKNKGTGPGEKKLPPPPAIGPEQPEGIKGGALVAWDPVTQSRRWIKPGGGGMGGGTVTTAGNLVFQVINDGRLLAYSADKGEKLLEIQTGLRGGMGPPVTYELDGKQYITLAGGIGTGVPPRPAAAGEPARTAPNGPTALPKPLTFVLDGNAPLAGVREQVP